jgi:hypothetical protein
MTNVRRDRNINPKFIEALAAHLSIPSEWFYSKEDTPLPTLQEPPTAAYTQPPTEPLPGEAEIKRLRRQIKLLREVIIKLTE